MVAPAAPHAARAGGRVTQDASRECVSAGFVLGCIRAELVRGESQLPLSRDELSRRSMSYPITLYSVRCTITFFPIALRRRLSFLEVDGRPLSTAERRAMTNVNDGDNVNDARSGGASRSRGVRWRAAADPNVGDAVRCSPRG